MAQLFGFTPPRLPAAARPLIPRCWRCTTAPAQSLSVLLNETQPAAFVPPPDASSEFVPDDEARATAPLPVDATLAVELDDALDDALDDELLFADPGESSELLPLCEAPSWPVVSGRPDQLLDKDSLSGSTIFEMPDELIQHAENKENFCFQPTSLKPPRLGIEAVLTPAPAWTSKRSAPEPQVTPSDSIELEALQALSQAIGDDAEASQAAEVELTSWSQNLMESPCPEATLPSPQDLGAAAEASREVAPGPEGELLFSGECCPVCGEPYLRWPTQDLDYFERFGLSARYELDFDELERRYRFLCRELQYAREQANADVDWSALLETAYEQLQDGEHRASYLLSRQGRSIQPKPSDAAFLIELCEIGLAMDELGGVDAHVERGKLARDVAARYEEKLHSMIALFDGPEPNLEAAAGALREAKALHELLRQIELLDEM